MPYTDYLRAATKSQTLLLNEQSRNLEASGKKVYKFGFGQSPFLPPEHVMQALRDAVARKEYTPVQGLPDLRKAIAAFHGKVDGLSIDPNKILVAPGSKILLYTFMLAFKKADVLVPAPAWVSYAPQAEIIGHKVIRVACDYKTRWRVTPENLEKALGRRRDTNKPAILVLNYPGNPEGLTYSREELTALAAVLKKQDVWVISDEIYGLLHHQGKHVSLASVYPERTVITTGLSKWAGAGGWRLGVAILPNSTPDIMMETLLGLASETYSCAPVPIQVAATAAYQWDSRIEEYLVHQRRILAALGNHSAAVLAKAKVKVYPPEGGFYLFVDFTRFKRKLRAIGIESDIKMCEKLLADTGVALLPGSAFGLKETALAARLAYVEFDGTAAMAASKVQGLAQPIDETFLKTYCPHTLEGIRLLAQWCKNL